MNPPPPLGERVALRAETLASSQFFFRESSQKPLTLHFFVWVILGGPHPIVVDTGCTEADAKVKELRAFVSPADMLARVGVKAAEVPMTLVSHLHWDHWGGYPYFPGSTFWMQREELEFWTGIAGQHENYRSFALPESLAQLVRLNYSGRVKLVTGEAEVRYRASKSTGWAVTPRGSRWCPCPRPRARWC